MIRDSFRTANESGLFTLKEWYLCIPTRPTKDDVRWFDTWKSKQSVKEGQATAGSAIVVASNGYYAAAWGQFLNAEGAAAKATELCQKKGGIDIKVLASAGSVLASSGGRLCGAIAASGYGLRADNLWAS
jgi:hypothetical protein